MIILDKYQIIEEVGRGGMGLVYRAQDLRLGRTVAIKELILSEAIIGQDREDIIARFKREAQTAANLSHPNIVTIFDVGEENNRHFIAMEYLPGKTLKDYLDEGYDYSLEEVTDILIQIASGLEHAHSRGVVHRDIKPGNMKILEDNVVKVTDFGVARIESSTSNLTQDGTMLGTLGYISPEQLHNSKGVDTRADIFSFGAMMYELFTKKLPFDGGTVGSTILKIMTEEPVPVRQLNPEIPESIEKMIQKCLQKDPDRRYQKAKEIIKELTLFKMLLEHDETKKLISAAVAGNTANEEKPAALMQPPPPPPMSASNPGYNNAVKHEPPPPTATTTQFAMPRIPETRPEYAPSHTQPGLKRNTFIEKSPVFNGNSTASAGNAGINHASAGTSDAPSDIRISFVRIIGRMGVAKGQFSSPRGLTLSRQGILFVADTQNRRVQLFDTLGTYQNVIQQTEMQSPCDVAVDSTGKIYVIDSVDAKVRVFDSSGKIIGRFGGKGTNKGQFRSTSGIAISKDDKIYITDTEGYKVQVFDTQGQILTMFGKYGTKPGEYKSPYGIDVDENRVYILDYGIPRVQVIDKDGISRLVFGQRGTSKGQFSIPKGIGVDKFGRIYVADTLNHRIQVFDNKGKWLYAFGSKGNGQGQFMGPEAISISNDGYIFVLDKGNNRVQVFTYEV